ncbi:MAG: hypothetical protein WAU84_24090, partial [Thermoguttaceae bacterium]
QPIGCDPPRMNIFPELLNIHATLIADFPKSGSASFQGMDSYPTCRFCFRIGLEALFTLPGATGALLGEIPSGVMSRPVFRRTLGSLLRPSPNRPPSPSLARVPSACWPTFGDGGGRALLSDSGEATLPV